MDLHRSSSILRKEGDTIMPYMYNGKDISPLILLVAEDYHSKYPILSFDGDSLREKLISRRDAIIQTAKDISDISEI